jgi:hypothetical protein
MYESLVVFDRPEGESIDRTECEYAKDYMLRK